MGSWRFNKGPLRSRSTLVVSARRIGLVRRTPEFLEPAEIPPGAFSLAAGCAEYRDLCYFPSWIEEIRDDERFQALEPLHRYALLVAALRFSDGRGYIDPFYFDGESLSGGKMYEDTEAWALEAAIPERTVEEALAAAINSGLMHVETVDEPGLFEGEEFLYFDRALQTDHPGDVRPPDLD